jgi:hypothetical protein
MRSKGTEPQGKELLLIGTVHRDPEGALKLRRILTKERPIAVAVEVSPYALLYRRRNGRRLRRRLIREVSRCAQTLGVSWRCWGQIRAIKAQLLEPYEYREALRYCRDTGAALSCLDFSKWSKRIIHNQWQELLSRDNLVALLEQTPKNIADEVQRSYRLALRLLSHQGQDLVRVFTESWITDPNWERREAELTSGLQRLYGRLQEGRLAYVGGWHHLLRPSGIGTLFERLEHLRPRRLLLHEV